MMPAHVEECFVGGDPSMDDAALFGDDTLDSMHPSGGDHTIERVYLRDGPRVTLRLAEGHHTPRDVRALRLLDLGRLRSLVRWLTADEQNAMGDRTSCVSSDRLRLVMAEYQQIFCRGMPTRFVDGRLETSWCFHVRTPKVAKEVRLCAAVRIIARSSAEVPRWRSQHRQLGSLCQLVRLANCDRDSNVDFWA